MNILDDFLKPDVTAREVEQNLFSVFDAEAQGAPYDSKNVVFLQADALNLPVKDQCVSTRLCHGAFHLLPSLDSILAE